MIYSILLIVEQLKIIEDGKANQSRMDGLLSKQILHDYKKSLCLLSRVYFETKEEL